LRTATKIAIGILAVTAGVLGTPALAASAVDSAVIVPTLSFPAATQPDPMGMTFDGTSFWSVAGGGSDGTNEARYDADGNVTGTYSPNIDFRSISSDDAGTIYASGFASSEVYLQTSPGVFAPFVDLAGGNPNSQGSLQVNPAGDGFFGMNNGVITTWGLDGSVTGTVALDGYVSSGNPWDVHVALVNGHWITRSRTDGVVSEWSSTGTLLRTLTIDGVPDQADFIAGYSTSGNRAQLYLATDGVWYVVPFYSLTVNATAALTAGASETATATLHAADNPTGPVVFSLYGAGDADCSGTPIATSSVAVTDSTATSPSHEFTAAGTYHWVASYASDGTNAAVASRCAAAPVVVTAAALDHLTLSPATASITSAETQDYTATGADQYDNPLGTQTGVTYTVTGGTCAVATCSASIGTHTVTGTEGSATGTATLTVTALAPTVTTDPADATTKVGGSASFIVVAGGDPSTTQWQASVDGGATWNNIAGATHATLTVGNVSPSQDGEQFRAVLKNTGGEARSAAATLTVSPATFVVTNSADDQLASGAHVSVGDKLTATLTGVAADSRYQVDVHSATIRVAGMTADAAGTATATFAVPQGLSAGEHTIEVVNSTNEVIGTLSIVIDPASALAFTGTDGSLAGPIALGLLLAGLGAVAVSRRRKRSPFGLRD
jgi:VCBS repeat-containing protein